MLKDSNANLWLFNNNSWKKLSGIGNQPKSINKVFGHPNSMSIVIEDNDEHNLWLYDGKLWFKQTGGISQPDRIDIYFITHQRQLQK